MCMGGLRRGAMTGSSAESKKVPAKGLWLIKFNRRRALQPGACQINLKLFVSAGGYLSPVTILPFSHSFSIKLLWLIHHQLQCKSILNLIL